MQSDVSNCGTCGKACATGEKCCSGVCTGTTSDAKNCGTCGNVCPTSAPVCNAGTCGRQCNSLVSNGVQVNAAASGGSTLTVQLKVCNTSSTSLSTNGMKLKYWYNDDGGGTQTVIVNNNGGVGATAAIETPTTTLPNSNSVLVVTLGAGTIAGGSTSSPTCMSGTIQITIQHSFSTPVNLTNDWSNVGTTLAKDQNATAYNSSGTLVWGIEPC
jgi:predicted extracellular nuclease